MAKTSVTPAEVSHAFVCPPLTDSSSATIRNLRLLRSLRALARTQSLSVTNDGRCWTVDGDLCQGLSGSQTTTPAPALLRKYLRGIVPDRLYWAAARQRITAPPSIAPFDVLWSASDPKGIHLAARAVHAQNTDSLRIQYWGDPWFDDLNYPTHSVTRRLESALLAHADLILYNSFATLERQKNLFPRFADRMSYLPRGVDEKVLSLPNEIVIPKEHPRLLYAGDYFSASRDITPLLDAISGTRSTLTVVGSGDQHRTNPQVTWVGRQSLEHVERLERESDVIVVVLNRAGTQLPGKLFDAAATAKPVLLLHHGSIPHEALAMRSRLECVRNEPGAISAWLSRSEDFRFRTEQAKSQVITALLGDLLQQKVLPLLRSKRSIG